MGTSKTASARALIDPQIKKEAEAILNGLGLSVSKSFELYYRQIIAHRGLPFELHIPNEKSPREISLELINLWCRGTESNSRHGDFQTNIIKIENCYNYKQLILFQFFNLLLVSFGTIWKYLTLTGTIWAQFSITIKMAHHMTLAFS